MVVFDKIRENTTTLRKSSESYADAANLAVNQTLVRSINTSIVALIPIGAILYVSAVQLGASSLQDLALAQFVGMAAGIYSSVFLAPRVLVHLKSTETEVVEQARRARAKKRALADKYAAVPAVRGNVADTPDTAVVWWTTGRHARHGRRRRRGTRQHARACPTRLWARAGWPRPRRARWARAAARAGSSRCGRPGRSAARSSSAVPGEPTAARLAAGEALDRLVRDVPDFPEPGIVFKDITPLLADPEGFRTVVTALAEAGRDAEGRVVVDKVVGMEARGFILAAPVALALGVGFVPVRKAGKLPGETHAVAYALEYGEAVLEVHCDGLAPGRAGAGDRRRAGHRRHRPRHRRARRARAAPPSPGWRSSWSCRSSPGARPSATCR